MKKYLLLLFIVTGCHSFNVRQAETMAASWAEKLRYNLIGVACGPNHIEFSGYSCLVRVEGTEPIRLNCGEEGCIQRSL